MKGYSSNGKGEIFFIYITLVVLTSILFFFLLSLSVIYEKLC
jgi:hypothetical protein